MTDAAFALFDTPIGRFAISWRGGLVVYAWLTEAREDLLRERLAARFPNASEAAAPDDVVEIMDQVTRLLSGEPVDLSSVPLDLPHAARFERDVYAAARAIPCGEVRTYGEIARQVGAPGAARAVGRALGRNPIPIIIPCHRVLAAAGKGGGFSAPGGASTKFRMLEIEKARRSADPLLFDSLPMAVRPPS